jgi:small-conductance mechanosensitive channel
MTRAQLLSRGAALVALLTPLPALAQEAPDISRIADFVRWTGVVLSVPVFVGAAVLVRLISDVASRLSQRFASRRPLIQKIESVGRFIVYLLAASVSVGLSVRLDPTALAVIGGALAFAVGFAMRDLVAAFIAGLTIMFDRPFQVGDRVAFGGEYGDITKIGLRSVQMNTLDHNIVTIPNNKVLTEVTASGNYGALEMQVAMEFFIGIDQNARRAVEIVREACLASPYVYLARPLPVFVQQRVIGNQVALVLRARPYVFDCQYEEPFFSDVHLRVLEAFAREGIGPPALLQRRLGQGESAALLSLASDDGSGGDGGGDGGDGGS